MIAALGISAGWFALPLALAISLVYNASRYEDPGVISRSSLRHFVVLSLVMFGGFLLLYLLSKDL